MEDSIGPVGRIVYVEGVRLCRRRMLRTADSVMHCASTGILCCLVSLGHVHTLGVLCPVRLPPPLYTLALSDYP